MTTPAAVATWQYTVGSGTWTSFTDLETSAGNDSDGGGVAVQRAAEGAGVSVPELGRSWYFGGHLDYLTTPGWSDEVARVYLKTLLEFTHPGYANDAVTALRDAGAPAGGAYRNITQGGVQSSAAFTERADGVLVFVPGWGTSGVLIGLAGGTASDFTDDMSQLDVYDIASSTWYHQTTTGTAPGVRVNPCAVVASAPDASSFQIYLFGGQNLQPAVSVFLLHEHNDYVFWKTITLTHLFLSLRAIKYSTTTCTSSPSPPSPGSARSSRPAARSPLPARATLATCATAR